MVKGAVCDSNGDPHLKIGGGVKREDRGERGKQCQVLTGLQRGKHRFHYSVAQASCTGSLRGFSNLLSFALH